MEFTFWELGVVGKRASLPFYLQERKEQMLSKCYANAEQMGLYKIR
jgi:hypothetical protein